VRFQAEKLSVTKKRRAFSGRADEKRITLYAVCAGKGQICLVKRKDECSNTAHNAEDLLYPIAHALRSSL